MSFRRCLIVDDDPDMRLYLSRCLRAIGVGRVVEAADGEEALTLARSGVDLVISGVALPRLDGFGLCRALGADVRTRGVPVLLFGRGDEDPPAGSAGHGFLREPFNARRLREAVEGLPGGGRPPPGHPISRLEREEGPP